MKYLPQSFGNPFSSLSLSNSSFLEKRFLFNIEGGACYPEAAGSTHEKKEEQNKCHQKLTALRHRVKRGDTLGAIANRYNTSVSALQKANNITNKNLIRVGQQLTISQGDEVSPHSAQSVEKNDNNTSISDLFQNPDIAKTGIIELSNNKPALRDFIDPDTFKNLSFTLQNARGQKMKIALKNGDWRVVQNGMVSNRRALIWKGENQISNVQEKQFARSRNEAMFQNAEVLAENLVRVRCTSAEAIEFERQQKVFDESGRRIIYYITDTRPFTTAKATAQTRTDGTPYQKQFLAFHGTGFNEEKFGKVSDFTVTRSAINAGVRSADFAFLVGKSGAIYQFFDENTGYGALGGRHLQRNGLGEDMNRETIAIELALRGNYRKYGYGVEHPKEDSPQLIAGKALRDFLVAKYQISDDHVITSKDPVRGVWGSHADDFDETRRLALGIQTRQDAQMLVAQLQHKQNEVLLASRTGEGRREA
jgi:murein DD-endopeptidase MepM/ murein hydrolase activator NlpD